MDESCLSGGPDRPVFPQRDRPGDVGAHDGRVGLRRVANGPEETQAATRGITNKLHLFVKYGWADGER